MKRPPRQETVSHRFVTGDIRKDLSPKQLEEIGAIAIAYNDIEAIIHRMFADVTGIPQGLCLEVSTRINGIEGIIAIITIGTRLVGVQPDDQTQIEEMLGNGVFKLLKKYRDAVVHARVINAPFGIGERTDRQAKVSEVLLSLKALQALYRHLVALRDEIDSAARLVLEIKMFSDGPQNDQDRARLAAKKLRWSAQLRRDRTRRLSLPPIPEFPSESELNEALERWWQTRTTELMG
jgi:hypothetical protein